MPDQHLVNYFIEVAQRWESVLVCLFEVEADNLAPFEGCKIVEDCQVFLAGQRLVAEHDDSDSKAGVLLADESELLINYLGNLGVFMPMDCLAALRVLHEADWFKPELNTRVVKLGQLG